MHNLGPAPNGKYENGTMEPLFSSENLSGSNSSGLVKYFGSRCIQNIGIRSSSFILICKY